MSFLMSRCICEESPAGEPPEEELSSTGEAGQGAAKRVSGLTSYCEETSPAAPNASPELRLSASGLRLLNYAKVATATEKSSAGCFLRCSFPIGHAVGTALT